MAEVHTIKFTFLVLLLTNIVPSMSAGDILRLVLFKKCVTTSGLSSDAIIDRKTGGSDYNFLNHQWNLRIPTIYPLAYVLPTSTKHVQASVFCARKLNLPVVPKSGGHSYESYSSGNSRSLIIDFRNMSSIKINAKNSSVKIGPGALGGQVLNKLWKSRKFGLTMGDCLSIGLGGYTLGGGTGHQSYLYGLAIDNLIEMTMVDAKGGAHTVNANRNSDLFWALRGVGSGMIGIFERKHALEFLLSWQKWFAWADKNEPYVFASAHIEGPVKLVAAKGCNIELTYIQDPIRQPAPNKAFLRAVHDIFPTDIVKITTTVYTSYIDFLHSVSYAQFEGIHDQDIDWENPRKYLQIKRYHKRTSLFINQYFNASAWEKAAELIRNLPKNNVWLEFYGERGMVGQIPPGAMAYVHRKSLFDILISYEGSKDPKDVAEGIAWTESFMSSLKEVDSGETYQNYPDSKLKNYLQRYYGSNLPRLMNIKQRWDPDNYLQNPQSIPVEDI